MLRPYNLLFRFSAPVAPRPRSMPFAPALATPTRLQMPENCCRKAAACAGRTRPAHASPLLDRQPCHAPSVLPIGEPNNVGFAGCWRTPGEWWAVGIPGCVTNNPYTCHVRVEPLERERAALHRQQPCATSDEKRNETNCYQCRAAATPVCAWLTGQRSRHRPRGLRL